MDFNSDYEGKITLFYLHLVKTIDLPPLHTKNPTFQITDTIRKMPQIGQLPLHNIMPFQYPSIDNLLPTF